MAGPYPSTVRPMLTTAVELLRYMHKQRRLALSFGEFEYRQYFVDDVREKRYLHMG